MQFNVIGAKFNENGKVYFFDPKELDIKTGDEIIVETNKGIEFALVCSEIKSVDEREVVLPLKPVLRKATDKDKVQRENNLTKAKEMAKAVEELIAKFSLDMRVVDIEYVFDGSKVVISFVSESRVDFRDLVKELASKFKSRIELRQIGIRDKAKAIGGIGPCGRECCCKSHLNTFDKVSIKMAKVQGLSLNPTQISGLCGRLLCCLEYENPYYSEVTAKMPKIGSTVKTPEGSGTVIYQNILKQKVSVKIQSGEDSFTIKDFDLSQIKF